MHLSPPPRHPKDCQRSFFLTHPPLPSPPFSSGPTRPETHLTEAESYAQLAAAHQYFGQLGSSSSSVSEIETEAQRRVFCETRALDSYGNVLFSVVAFWRRYGGGRRWPTRLTVVSHGFKRTRLVAGHCGPAALAWPAARLGFVGVDPPAMADGSHVAALAGAARAEADWRRDPHGTGPELAAKRRRRNPWGVGQDLFDCDEERRRSGVRTIRVDGQEVLDPSATQPWSSL